MSDAQNFKAALQAKTDPSMGVTDWFCYEQGDVDTHGGNSGDDGPIHNDPEWCKANTPYGGTIVQGSLLLSTFTQMAKSLVWPDGDMHIRLNYGYDKVRIVQPVKTGQRFRARFDFNDVTQKSEKALMIKVDVTLEGESDDGPAIVAEWLFYVEFAS